MKLFTNFKSNTTNTICLTIKTHLIRFSVDRQMKRRLIAFYLSSERCQIRWTSNHLTVRLELFQRNLTLYNFILNIFLRIKYFGNFFLEMFCLEKLKREQLFEKKFESLNLVKVFFQLMIKYFRNKRHSTGIARANFGLLDMNIELTFFFVFDEFHWKKFLENSAFLMRFWRKGFLFEIENNDFL